MNMNVAVFKAINGIAHESGLLDKIMIVFSKYGPVIWVFIKRSNKWKSKGDG